MVGVAAASQDKNGGPLGAKIRNGGYDTLEKSVRQDDRTVALAPLMPVSAQQNIDSRFRRSRFVLE